MSPVDDSRTFGAVLSIVAVVAVISTPPLRAQESESLVEVSGTATISADIYELSSEASSPIASRRPPSLFRFILTPTVTLGGRVSLPFEIIFSSRETSTLTPPIRDASATQFIQNAANTFSLSPRFEWGQIHLGSHSPQLSELSAGNVQVFGVGADVRAGKFRIAASAGSTQRAAEADTVARSRGAYARYLYAGSIAYIQEESEFALNVVRGRDDPASINHLRSLLIVAPDTSNPGFLDTTSTHHDLMPLPQEGFVASMSARLPLFAWAKLSAEIGGGLFTRDMLAPEIGDRAEALNALMLQRTSSRADGAGKLAIDLTFDRWKLKLTSLYVGAGYTTLGYPFLQTDKLEFTLAPTIRVIDSVLTISGTIGHRTNNLTGNSEATTRQILIATNVDAQPIENLTIAASYSNFGITTNLSNDTLSVRTVSQAFSITPTYVIPTETLSHAVTAGISMDDYEDFNPVSGAQSSNQTTMLLGAYSASLIAIPLTASAAGTHMTNNLPGGDISVRSLTLGLGYSLFSGSLAPALSVSYTQTTPEGKTSDTQLGLRLTTVWRVTPRLRFTLSASTTGYDYGSSRAGSSYRESLLRTALTWQI